MKFTVALTPYRRFSGPEDILKTAALADRLGFYALNFGDHIALPSRLEGAFDHVYYDQCVMGMAITAKNPNVRVYFNVLVVPYRQPVPTAKAIASLDVLSGGRVIVGAGVGMLTDEFESVGAPFNKRGAMTDEYLRAMKVLWTHSPASFDGQFVTFTDVHSEPQPVQKPHPPIWIAVTDVPRTLERAVELGDGAAILNRPHDVLKRDLDTLRHKLVQGGRDPDNFAFQFSVYLGGEYEGHRAHFAVSGARMYDVLSFDHDEAIRQVEAYRAMGLTHLSLRLNANGYEEHERLLTPFAENVMRKFE